MLKALKIFLILLLSTLLLLILSEIYLRYIGLGNPLIYKKSLDFGYLPKENQQITRFNNSQITIDKNNFRNSDISPSNNNKIYFLGDSVTYGGSYIDDNDLFSSKVCKKLKVIDNYTFTCLNGGVNAYGFENIFKRLEFLDYKEKDFVVITFILGNFYRNFIQIESLPYFTKKNNNIFKANLELFSYFLDKLRNKIRFKERKFKDYQEKDNFAALKLKIEKDISKIKNLSNNNGNIIILFSPSKNNYKKKNLFEIEDYLFDNFTNNINFFSLKDYIKVSQIDKIYHDNIHLNSYGHEVYADIITKIILNKIKNE